MIVDQWSGLMEVKTWFPVHRVIANIYRVIILVAKSSHMSSSIRHVINMWSSCKCQMKSHSCSYTCVKMCFWNLFLFRCGSNYFQCASPSSDREERAETTEGENCSCNRWMSVNADSTVSSLHVSCRRARWTVWNVTRRQLHNSTNFIWSFLYWYRTQIRCTRKSIEIEKAFE